MKEGRRASIPLNHPQPSHSCGECERKADLSAALRDDKFWDMGNPENQYLDAAILISL